MVALVRRRLVADLRPVHARARGVQDDGAQAATQALHQAGFQVRTGPSVIDDNVPKGEVISTSPSGRALPGATIVLTVSHGPRMIRVPSIPTGDAWRRPRRRCARPG